MSNNETAAEHLKIIASNPSFGPVHAAVDYLLRGQIAREATPPDPAREPESEKAEEPWHRYPPTDPAREPEVVDEPGVGAVVRDRHGDLWTSVGGGIWSTPETAEMPWDRIVRKYAPLALVTPATPTPTEGDGEVVEALARVRALVAPGWRGHPSDLPDEPVTAYVRGRNDMLDDVRAALTGPAR